MIDNDKLIELLVTSGLSPKEISKETATNGGGLFGKLCPLLGVSNTLNRTKIYQRWRKEKIQCHVRTDIDNNAINQDVQLTHTANVDCEKCHEISSNSSSVKEVVDSSSDATRDLTKKPQSHYQKCTILCKQVNLEDCSQLAKVSNDNLELSDQRDAFRDLMSKEILCLFNFSNFKLFNSTITAYLYCLHEGCRLYKCSINRSNELVVLMDGDNVNHVYKYVKRRLHGQAKKYVRDQLKFVKPAVLHTQLYVDGLPGMEKHEIPSKAVLKKISSSEKACWDLDKDNLSDLTGRMTRDMELHKHDGEQVFLKVPAIPMEVVMIC